MRPVNLFSLTRGAVFSRRSQEVCFEVCVPLIVTVVVSSKTIEGQSCTPLFWMLFLWRFVRLVVSGDACLCSVTPVTGAASDVVVA